MNALMKRLVGWMVLWAGLGLWSPEAPAQADDPRSIDPWKHSLLQLTHADRMRREAALNQLSRANLALEDPRMVRALLQLLHDSSWRIRMAIAELLGRTNSPEAEVGLTLLAKDEHRQVRLEAVKSLGQFTVIPIPALTLAAADEDMTVRETALTILNQHRTPAMLPTFVRALNDKMDGTRFLAIEGLLHLGAPGLHILKATLVGSDPRSSNAVKNYLQTTNDPKSFSLLETAAESPATPLRELAAHRLGLYQEPRALTLLTLLAHDTAPTVRRIALKGLGATHHPDALAVLTLAVQDSELTTRIAAAEGLAQLQVKESTDALAALLRDPSIAIVMLGVQGLKGLGDGPSAAALETAYPRAAPLVRTGIVTALQDMGREGIRALCRLLLSANPEDVPNLIQALASATDQQPQALDDRTRLLLTETAAPLLGSTLATGQYASLLVILHRGGPSAVPVLGAEILKHEGHTRWNIVQMLIQMNLPETLPYLVKAIDWVDRKNFEVNALQNAIQRFGAAGWPEARRLLSHPEDHIRQTAVTWAGMWRAIDDLDTLIRLVTDDPSIPIRVQAAQALGRLLDVRAVPALKQALKHSDRRLQDTARQALRDIGAVENDPFQPRTP